MAVRWEDREKVAVAANTNHTIPGRGPGAKLLIVPDDDDDDPAVFIAYVSAPPAGDEDAGMRLPHIKDDSIIIHDIELDNVTDVIILADTIARNFFIQRGWEAGY